MFNATGFAGSHDNQFNNMSTSSESVIHLWSWIMHGLVDDSCPKQLSFTSGHDRSIWGQCYDISYFWSSMMINMRYNSSRCIGCFALQ